MIQPAHPLVNQEPAADRSRKEEEDLENRHSNAAGAALSALSAKSCNDRQDNDSQHIVNDCRTDDRRPDPVIQLPKLLQGGNRDAHGSCGHDRPHKQSLHEAFGARRIEAIESHKQERAKNDGNQYAHTGHQCRLQAGLFQILQIGSKSGLKHQHDDADLSHHGKEIRLLDKAENSRADHKTRQDLADNLRHPDLLPDRAEDLRRKQNNCQIQKISYAIHTPLPSHKDLFQISDTLPSGTHNYKYTIIQKKMEE